MSTPPNRAGGAVEQRQPQLQRSHAQVPRRKIHAARARQPHDTAAAAAWQPARSQWHPAADPPYRVACDGQVSAGLTPPTSCGPWSCPLRRCRRPRPRHPAVGGCRMPATRRPRKASRRPPLRRARGACPPPGLGERGGEGLGKGGWKTSMARRCSRHEQRTAARWPSARAPLCSVKAPCDRGRSPRQVGRRA
jgi:hypothetical protein